MSGKGLRLGWLAEEGGRCVGGGHSGNGGSVGTVFFSLDATDAAAACAVAAALPSLSLSELDLLKVLWNKAFMGDERGE